jgi:hypothetical protein
MSLIMAKRMQLSGNDIENVETTVDDYTLRFLDFIGRKIDAAPDKTAELDLSVSIPLLTLDMITHLCLGEPLESIENETNALNFLKALNLGMLLQQYVSIIPETSAIALSLGKLPWFRTKLFPKSSSPNGIGRAMIVSMRAHKSIPNIC